MSAGQATRRSGSTQVRLLDSLNALWQRVSDVELDRNYLPSRWMHRRSTSPPHAPFCCIPRQSLHPAKIKPASNRHNVPGFCRIQWPPQCTYLVCACPRALWARAHERRGGYGTSTPRGLSMYSTRSRVGGSGLAVVTATSAKSKSAAVAAAIVADLWWRIGERAGGEWHVQSCPMAASIYCLAATLLQRIVLCTTMHISVAFRLPLAAEQ